MAAAKAPSDRASAAKVYATVSTPAIPNSNFDSRLRSHTAATRPATAPSRTDLLAAPGYRVREHRIYSKCRQQQCT